VYPAEATTIESLGNNVSSHGVRRNMGVKRLLSVFLILSGTSFSTKERPHLPCEYSGVVSRRYLNTAFAMSSDATKARATQKVDLSGPAKQREIRGDVGVDVLVGPDGTVICTSGYMGHPMVVKDVEEAVRQWKFKPLTENNKPVAFVGSLNFALCNIGCTEAGRSMTLLAQ
jgi:Gram-negative bacterial TonB protein C-terminal